MTKLELITINNTVYETVLMETPSILKIKGKATITKTTKDKYVVSNITYFSPTYSIVAIGYPNCTHIMNNIAYNKQKKLGSVLNSDIINTLHSNFQL